MSYYRQQQATPSSLQPNLKSWFPSLKASTGKWSEYNVKRLLPHISEQYNFRITNKLLAYKIINPKRDKIIMNSLQKVQNRNNSRMTTTFHISRTYKNNRRKVDKQINHYQTVQSLLMHTAADIEIKEVHHLQHRPSTKYQQTQKQNKQPLDAQTCNYMQQNNNKQRFIGKIRRNVCPKNDMIKHKMLSTLCQINGAQTRQQLHIQNNWITTKQRDSAITDKTGILNTIKNGTILRLFKQNRPVDDHFKAFG